MNKQLKLALELIQDLTGNLDEYTLKDTEKYTKYSNTEYEKRILREVYKIGALMVLGKFTDLLKKYTDLHES